MTAIEVKQDILNRITQIEDRNALEYLLSFIKKINFEEKDWWDTISQEERDGIDRGILDIEKGRVVSHQEIQKKYEKWL